MTVRPIDAPVLSVEDLTVRYGRAGTVAVDRVSFDLSPGEVLCIVGESGAGKSTVAYALMGLIDGGTTQGRALLKGADLLAADGRAMRAARGRDLCLVVQDPMSSLNPLMRVGGQIAESLRVKLGVGRAEAARRAVEALRAVGIPAPEMRARDYPHQMSGGMLQRAVIAAAVAMEPAVIIADEPTTALDTTIQAQIVDLLLELVRASRAAMIFVTHNLALVAEIADSIAVMYAGSLVEIGPKAQVLDAPAHPYTAALLRAIPRMHDPDRVIAPIPGSMPAIGRLPEGCAFHPRCERAVRPACLTPPPLAALDGGHRSACHFAGAGAA